MCSIDPRDLCVCGAQPLVTIQSPTGRKFSVSDRERKSIGLSWAKIADKESLGQDIFRNIFTSKPTLKRLWGLQEVTLEDLNASSKFHMHAKNFIMFLDIAVRGLSLDGDYVISLAQTVGKRHVLFKEVSFDAEYWLLFKSAVMKALDPYISSPEVKLRWNHFLMFLVTEVKDAFNKEVQRSLTRPPKSAFFPRWVSLTDLRQHFTNKSSTAQDTRKESEGLSMPKKYHSFTELRAELDHIQNCLDEEENITPYVAAKQ